MIGEALVGISFMLFGYFMGFMLWFVTYTVGFGFIFDIASKSQKWRPKTYPKKRNEPICG